jgi:PIN domain nuclease of toxin-antitoxin system
MRVLLDTHLLLWALGDPARLSKAARSRIDDCEVYVSAASIWEVSIKAALGKLKAEPLSIVAAVSPAGFKSLAITAAHAAHVHDLPGLHRDPFDRLLIAQAQQESMVLLTNDQALAAYGAAVQVV